MNINPIIILISQVISLYNFILVVYCVAGWLIGFGIVNKNNRFVSKLMYTFGRVTEPLLQPVRKYMPDLGGIDLSPIVVFLGMNFIRNVLFTYFYVK